MQKGKHRHYMAFSLFDTYYKTARILPDHQMEVALIRS